MKSCQVDYDSFSSAELLSSYRVATGLQLSRLLITADHFFALCENSLADALCSFELHSTESFQFESFEQSVCRPNLLTDS